MSVNNKNNKKEDIKMNDRVEKSLTTFKDSYLSDLGELLQKDNELEARMDKISEYIEQDFKWKIRVNKVIGILTGIEDLTAFKQKSDKYIKENK